MIRPAEPRDVPTIHALIRELARYEKLEHEAVATEEQIRASLFGRTPPHAEVLVVEPDGTSPATGGSADVLPARGPSPERGRNLVEASRVVGFALFFHNYSTFLGRPGLYLEDLFVLPDWRRQGYGKALLRALARIAVDRGCGRLEWSVLAWNEPALRFYESLGATLMVEWRICRVVGDAIARLARHDEDDEP